MSRTLLVYGAAIVAGLVLFSLIRALFGYEIVLVLSIGVLVVAVVIIFRNLATNRKVTEANPAQRSEALAFAPAESKAVLFIYRNQFVGRAVGINVLIDGREVAHLKSPRFTRLMLTPGAHRIAGYTGTNKKPGDGEGMMLNAAAGDVLVLKCEVEPQIVGVTVKFTPMSAEAARADVQKIARMVVPDAAEV